MVTKHFFVKLIPPRPTFPVDMTDAERAHMREHVAYFGGLFAQGKVLIYGPVMDAESAFGMGVVEAESEADARALLEADPTVSSRMNRFTLAPMIVGAARAHAPA